MSTHWTRSNEVVWEELDGEVLLVSPRSGGRWLLNAAGAAIWRLCDGTRSLAEMAANLTGAGVKDARVEIAAFCGRFEQLGLIQAAGANGKSILVPAHAAFDGLPGFRQLNAGGGGRKRPSPRGVSGPV